MALTLEMAEMREEIERLNAEGARLKAKPEPSSQELMDYPLPEPEVELKAALEANRGKRNVIDSQAAKQNHGKNNGVAAIDLTTVTMPRLSCLQRSNSDCLSDPFYRGEDVWEGSPSHAP